MRKQVAAAPREHTVPTTLVTQLAELLRRRRVSPEELLAGSGFSEVPVDPFGRLPLETMMGLLERACLLTGEPGLGYYLGLQERASTYGYVGLAATSASTVRGAIELVIRYAPLFSSALSISLHLEDGRAFLRLDENVDLGNVRDVILIHMMLGLETMANRLTGRSEHGATELAIAEPPYNARFAHLVPRWRFAQPANCIVMDADTLDWPILAADPLSLELMRSTCERALADLGFGDGVVEDVRRVIPREAGGFRSLSGVAEQMGLSERTLTRRLAAQGTSFSALVEHARRDQALVLLRSSRLSIEAVAERLEYASASTFIRAFRSWTGRTPAAYRREGKRPLQR